MSHKNGSNGKHEYRRQLVTQALIERPSATQRQIQEAIGKTLLNNETGEPYSLGTINNDIKVVRQGWRDKATGNYGDWVAGELAKLDRLEEKAWAIASYDLILKCMQRRAKLLGLDQPQRLAHEGKDGGPLVIRVVYGNDGTDSSTP